MRRTERGEQRAGDEDRGRRTEDAGQRIEEGGQREDGRGVNREKRT